MIDFGNLKDGNNLIYGLTDELQAQFINYLYNKYNNDIIIVTNTIYEANKMHNYLTNYNKNASVFLMDEYIESEMGVVSPELKVSRIELLDNLLINNRNIIITNLTGYLKELPDKEFIAKNIFNLKKGTEINKDELFHKLCNLGYSSETIINKTGDIANRGFILDIFPVNSSDPIRIEFFGDEIESIKLFNIDTQLTFTEVEFCSILPFIDEPIDKVKSSISSYLNNPIVIYIDYNRIINEYEQLQNDLLLIKNGKKLQKIEEFFYKYNVYMFSVNSMLPNINFDNTLSFMSTKIDYFYNKEVLLKFIETSFNKKKYISICFNNINEVKKFKKEYDYNYVNNEYKYNCINVLIKNITDSYEINDYIYLSYSSLFSEKKNNNKFKSKFKIGVAIDDYKSLKKGDYVVHIGHGIGRYNGIVSLKHKNIIKDYLEVIYDENGKLYIPIEKIELLTKYSYDSSIEPKLNKLGGSEWEKTKLRVKGRLQNIAKDLIRVSLERKQQVGFSFKKDSPEQLVFENEFQYEETTDQLKCIKKIKECMENSYPMDVLLCGDVGYGKTEVAFRAMFKAICSNKQVAYLCPTTILSNQQYLSALERFKNFPVNIALVNRFTTFKEMNIILEKLKNGTIDILFGTHRLLSDNIKFKDLGLLVIDEEQRFGVTHKEKIKQIKSSIDVLTLSATPIPRTLQMSLMGVRDLCLIETPPMNRYPVQTYVLEENDIIIKNAIYKEISRNGQVFILCNRIENFQKIHDKLMKLVPDIKIDYVHGKMDKNDIEDVMLKFVNNEFNVLVCTTIIETGIDIPNTNTLIILDADHFGLSQLYQLRGRVGRTNKVAYCYLMYKNYKQISENASKRLNAIKEFASLGSGFRIAMRDLSIRGAGDVLGSEQSGFVDQIGIDLYMKMLNSELDSLNGIETYLDEFDNSVSNLVSTHIDDKYVANDSLKIEIHKMINNITSYETLEETKNILEDRFGKLDNNLIIYMYEELLENIKSSKGIKTITESENEIKIIFELGFEKRISIDELFVNTYKISKNFKFNMENKQLVIRFDIQALDKHWVFYLLDLLNYIK